MADPDEALIEAIAEALREVPAERRALARAAYAAMVEHLGLVEETRHLCSCGGNWDALQHTFTDVHEPQPVQRRLVSRWTEVDHGSE